jgi:hypothetical protein
MPKPDGPESRFSEDLVGLDPDDPEARAFAEHLDRMERSRPSFTVEGALDGIADFAESSNRIGGPYRLFIGLVVLLIAIGVLLGGASSVFGWW